MFGFTGVGLKHQPQLLKLKYFTMNRLLFSLLLLLSCSNQSATSKTNTTDTLPLTQTNNSAKGEQLMGLLLDVDSQMLIITVISNGCTTKKDFRFTMDNGTLLIERNRTDDCKRMPFTTEFKFSFAEAGIEPSKAFQVRNKFASTFIN
jgi:hypothetical protein